MKRETLTPDVLRAAVCETVKTPRWSRGRRLWNALYLPEILRGLWITNKHFWQNILNAFTHRSVTFQYPEKKRPTPPDARYYHRLVCRPEGGPKCVACMCCATACPAACIEIIPGDRPGGPHARPIDERYPAEFNIDILRCVMCGMCVEACPVDAIRMDTGVLHDNTRTRGRSVRKEELMARRGVGQADESGCPAPAEPAEVSCR